MTGRVCSMLTVPIYPKMIFFCRQHFTSYCASHHAIWVLIICPCFQLTSVFVSKLLPLKLYFWGVDMKRLTCLPKITTEVKDLLILRGALCLHCLQFLFNSGLIRTHILISGNIEDITLKQTTRCLLSYDKYLRYLGGFKDLYRR